MVNVYTLPSWILNCDVIIFRLARSKPNARQLVILSKCLGNIGLLFLIWNDFKHLHGRIQWKSNYFLYFYTKTVCDCVRDFGSRPQIWKRNSFLRARRSIWTSENIVCKSIGPWWTCINYKKTVNLVTWIDPRQFYVPVFLASAKNITCINIYSVYIL